MFSGNRSSCYASTLSKVYRAHDAATKVAILHYGKTSTPARRQTAPANGGSVTPEPPQQSATNGQDVSKA